MSQPVERQSRKLAAAMRELVAYFLTQEGFDASPKPVHAKISDGLDLAATPDVVGLSGVWVDVANRGSHRLSQDLDLAQSDAAAAGYATTVLVAHRPGRDIGHAYAVLTLADFAKLVRADHLTPPP